MISRSPIIALAVVHLASPLRQARRQYLDVLFLMSTQISHRGEDVRAEIRPSCPELCPYSTYKRTSTIKELP